MDERAGADNVGYSKEQMREYAKERRAKRRDDAKEILGGCCAVCGSTERLEFHHIDPNTKQAGVANLWTAKEETLYEEVARCQLLCHDCHIEEGKRSGVFRVNVGWNHGTISGYRDKGCRCTACCDAYAAGLARHNERRKAQRRQRRLSRSTA